MPRRRASVATEESDGPVVYAWTVRVQGIPHRYEIRSSEMAEHGTATLALLHRLNRDHGPGEFLSVGGSFYWDVGARR